MKKRILAILLVVCMIAALVPAAFATGYSDVDGHWAEDAITRWTGYGIVEGNDGKFEPSGELTRGQIAAIIARLLKLPEAASAGFADVDGHWAEDAINSCAAAGIMLGDGVKARPGDAVTREEAMVLLARALGIKPVENASISGYKDAAKVSDWAEGYVAAMTDKGIVNGIDGSLEPASDLNRASAMTILNKAISTYANQEGQTVTGTGEGIVLVAAKNVTVTGEADGIVVSAGAEGGTTNITAAKADSVTVQAADADVNINSSEVKDVAVEAPQAEVTLTNTKTENVAVSEKAEDAKVEVGTGSTVTNVENKADGTTVSGSGTVSSVTTSGDNTKVETGGTKVEATPGTTGTTAGNQTVVGGGTATTTPTTPAPSVHSHYYSYKANDDGTHTGTCACTGTVTEACADGTDTDTKCDKCADDTAAYVATVGGKNYKTLSDAVAVGGEVVILKDITLAEGLTVAADKSVVLDLNGKTVSYNSAAPGEDMITNKGTLTIVDNSAGKNGKITYTNTDATAENVTVSTISTEPGSTVVVKGGAVENKSVKASGSSIYPYAIDLLTNGSLGDVTVTIEGGTVYSDYMAIRQFNNGDACKNTLNVTSGKIYGARRAVQVHFKNDAAYTTISGGIIEGGDYSFCGLTTSKNIFVNEGTFVGSVWYSGTEGFISGGTFDENPDAAYIVDGYEAVDNGDGTWSIKAAAYLIDAEGNWKIYDVAGLKALADYVNAGTSAEPHRLSGKTVTLMRDIDLKDVDYTPIGLDNDFASFFGTFDGNGKTISNLKVTTTEDRPIGLFGAVCYSGLVKNLTIDGATLTGHHYAGAVCGFSNYGVFENCTVKNVVITLTPNGEEGSYDNGDKAGGVVGYIVGGKGSPGVVTGCTVENLTITAYRDIGGFAGMAQQNDGATPVVGASVTGNTLKGEINLTIDQNTNFYGAKATNAAAEVGRISSKSTVEENDISGATVKITYIVLDAVE